MRKKLKEKIKTWADATPEERRGMTGDGYLSESTKGQALFIV